jgi:hypothetical protein
MQPTDAIDLVNVLSTSYGLRVRSGYRKWATGLPAGDFVGTIMSYYPPDEGQSSGSFKTVTVAGSLFAASNKNLYDITPGGSGPWTPLLDPNVALSNFWSWRNFQNAAGSFLLTCNHEGGYFTFAGPGFSSGFSNGFSVAGTGFTQIKAGTTPGDINGADPDTFAYLMVWKKRLWFVEKNSSRAWYLPPEQITGEVKQFDFGSQFRHGGNLVALANWTIDGGEGIDDLLVAVGSNGDIVIYKGYDPDQAGSDPNAFQLHGIWYAGPLPAGRRQVDPYGGDVHILTSRGTMPLSKLTQTSTIEQEMNVTISSKIDPVLTELISQFANSEDWYLKILPNEDLTVIGVPQTTGSRTVRQFTMVNTTNAWSDFEDLPVKCLLNHDHLTFGGTSKASGAGGEVYLMFLDKTDNVPLTGEPGDFIQARVIPAYAALGQASQYKSVPMVKPKILSTRNPTYSIKVLADYEFPGFSSSSPPQPTEQALWDRANWNQAKWAGTLTPILSWIGTSGGGYVITAQVDFQAEGGTRFTGMDYWTIPGGPL